jgi:predicted small lipoprotein YifL
MTRAHRILPALLLLLVAGCGLKGPLYLPDEKAVQVEPPDTTAKPRRTLPLPPPAQQAPLPLPTGDSPPPSTPPTTPPAN